MAPSKKKRMSLKLAVTWMRFSPVYPARYLQNVQLEPPMHVFLDANTIRIRQGDSSDEGHCRSYWILETAIQPLECLSLMIRRERVVYSCRITKNCRVSSRADTALSSVDVSEYPLASIPVGVDTILSFECTIPGGDAWVHHSATIVAALQGTGALVEEEARYIADNEEAVIAEADAEHKLLVKQGCRIHAVALNGRMLLGIWPADERPFRLYRGCTLVLKGTKWFARGNAAKYFIPNVKGDPTDWLAEVTEPSPKWGALVAAPIHAMLCNSVPAHIASQVSEEDVEVHPTSNPVVAESMLLATEELRERIGGDSFDQACRDFESQTQGSASTVSQQRETLPLSAICIPGVRKIDTEYRASFLDNETIHRVPAAWSMNATQVRAMMQILQHRFATVVGPPGTGKTRTVVATSLFLTQVVPPGGPGSARVAIVVPTHAAGEALISQMAQFTTAHNLPARFLRLRSRGDSEARLFAGKDSPHDNMGRCLEFAGNRPEYSDFRNGVAQIRHSGRVTAGQSGSKNYRSQKELLMEAVMKNCDVIVTTPLNVPQMVNRKFRPEYLIFDEASFYRDPEVYYVITRADCASRVLLVGDHKQLSPPVFTSAGSRAWGTPLFERLIDAKYPSTMLDTQYRTHGLLYRPTSRIFYDGKVQTPHGSSPWEGRLQELGGLRVSIGSQRWTVKRTAAFLDIRGTTSTDSSGSLSNDSEAKLALSLAAALRAAGVRDVLIMSPYKAQVARCSKLLGDLYPNANAIPRIQTVDASQGSEADAVIVTFARNANCVGFLRSRKRVNVMTSRHKHFQYFVGSWDWASSIRVKKDSPAMTAVLVEYTKEIPGFLVRA